MSFTDAIKTCFSKYFTFSGRASRPEYWWFVLFLFLGQAAAGIIDSAIYGDALTERYDIDEQTYATVKTSGPVASIFGLVTFIPWLSAGWRRMHDTGRSGLYLLYPFIVMAGLVSFAAFAGVTPDTAGWDSLDGIAALLIIAGILAFLISPFLVIWWLTRPSEPHSNDYGPHLEEVFS